MIRYVMMGLRQRDANQMKGTAMEVANNAVNYGTVSSVAIHGTASATGYRGTAISKGRYGKASSTGGHGTAMACGRDGQVMGYDDTVLVLIERDSNQQIMHVWSGIAGRDGIKAGVWYKLVDGEPVEAGEAETI